MPAGKRPGSTVDAVVKKALVVALVVLLVVIGLPILMPGMGAAHCADCGPAVPTSPLCLLAVLAGTVIAFAFAFRYLREHRRRYLELLLAAFFDRPPQLLPV